MKKFTLITLFCLLTTAVGAHPISPGYWYDSEGGVYKTIEGDCWKTGSWTKKNAIKECHPELFAAKAKPVPKPAAPKVIAKPKPKPMPAPKPASMPAPPAKIIAFGDLYFDFDKSEIKANYKVLLNQIATQMKSSPALSVTISGHTDSKGSDKYNMKLGQDRADQAGAYLRTVGINAARIHMTSDGESKPITSNDTEQGRAKNRRVEFTFR